MLPLVAMKESVIWLLLALAAALATGGGIRPSRGSVGVTGPIPLQIAFDLNGQ